MREHRFRPAFTGASHHFPKMSNQFEHQQEPPPAPASVRGLALGAGPHCIVLWDPSIPEAAPTQAAGSLGVGDFGLQLLVTSKLPARQCSLVRGRRHVTLSLPFLQCDCFDAALSLPVPMRSTPPLTAAPEPQPRLVSPPLPGRTGMQTLAIACWLQMETSCFCLWVFHQVSHVLLAPAYC